MAGIRLKPDSPANFNVFDLQAFLDDWVEEYNQPAFIEQDPIQIPHLFTRKQDIEISGFFAAIFAWGQRKTIVNKCHDLLTIMDYAPYDFILHHSENDLKNLLSFKHRTFNPTDLLHFVDFFHHFYQTHHSLEEALTEGMHKDDVSIENGLINLRKMFFANPDAPHRTKKHIASPEKNSSCKRLNMYLRWMVRKDEKGVDFGIWNNISPRQLICPCDVHVNKIARELGLIERTATDWFAAKELTQNLKYLDPHDPVKYDFALFGLGIHSVPLS